MRDFATVYLAMSSFKCYEVIVVAHACKPDIAGTTGTMNREHASGTEGFSAFDLCGPC